MFNVGDIVVGNRGANGYTVTRPGTEWVVYCVGETGHGGDIVVGPRSDKLFMKYSKLSGYDLRHFDGDGRENVFPVKAAYFDLKESSIKDNKSAMKILKKR